MEHEQQALAEREKYVLAFNQTMIEIWKERITLLDVMDTGALLQSPMHLPVQHDGRFFEVSLTQTFLEYGFWQDYGVGKETPKGNSGSTSRAGSNALNNSQPAYGSRPKVRQRRPWFSRKYYASVLNIRDFMADNIGKSFQGIIADSFAEIERHR